MEQNIALQRMIEIADLAKMVEELMAPGNLERLSPASLAGIRYTLRSIRDLSLNSHNSLVTHQGQPSVVATRSQQAEVASQSQASLDASVESIQRGESPAIVRPPASEQPRMVRKDLRATFGHM